jgi:3-deoxy-D-manno-octulosonate 8-phosphate phosphatase (KDO 8-P phosphatase)
MNYPEPILDKARHVRLLILDVDGVLTDGRLYYSESGEESKTFSTQDGAAIKMLSDTGVIIAIITGRQSKIVARRATELGVQHVYQGASDKARALEELILSTGIDRPMIAHVGDDLPDLPLFNRVGMTFTVPGAHPEVVERADYVTLAHAGLGAVREVCHLLMVAQETWAAALGRYDT